MKRDTITAHRLLNIAGALLIIAAGVMLIWPDDEASMQAAIAESPEIFHIARAAKEICKEKAAWTLIDGRVIQCFAEVKEVQP